MPKFSKDSQTLKQRATNLRKNKQSKKITLLLTNVIAVLTALVYVVSVMYNKFGGFTISINKFQQLKYGLSLSETKDFAKPTSMLNCKASEIIDNIDGNTLNDIDFGLEDGKSSKPGDNYLCYTFYCRNTGEETVNVQYSIVIGNMTLGIQGAVRVRLITKIDEADPTSVIYAKAKGLDEHGNVIPEPDPQPEGTTPFYSANTVMHGTVNNFEPQHTIKYTIVMWLEGWDEDCVDDIIGGEFLIDMKFSATPVEGQPIGD